MLCAILNKFKEYTNKNYKMSTDREKGKDQTEKKTLEPRRYQLELLEYVMHRNAIVYLPTGAGKTYVAILAIKRFSHQLQETIENGGKRAIFMCNTVELARQQAVEVKKNTNLKVGFYVGERDVDNWTRKKWNEEIAENQVLVGTAQILLDIVMHNYMKITDLSIVVIDECHNGKGHHPMHEFMSLFQFCDETKTPRVIGLTGVLLKGNSLNNIEKDLKDLEATYRGNIVTVSSMEEYYNVMVHSTKPIEEIVSYAADHHTFEVEKTIEMKIRRCAALVDDWDLGKIPLKLTKGLAKVREPNKKNFIKNIFKDFLHQMKDFGIYAGAIAIMSLVIEFELKKRQAETLALRNLYRFVITECEHIRHLLVTKLKDMLDEDNALDSQCHTIDIILNFSTSKLRSLLVYIKQKFAGKKYEDISCLIFVERRYSAKCLYYVIKRFVELTPELCDIVRPQFMVGRNSIAPGIESILDRKWNNSAIQGFREKECNLIICSSVLEEGIDVQACNHVFAFDPLKTFNSYIQTKGRARSSAAYYTIFTPKIDANATVLKVRKYQSVHEIIRKFLIGRILDRDDPKEEEINKQFTTAIPPYVIASGARLLPSSALGLLGQYCQTLPSDVYGAVMPWYCKVNDAVKGRCFVTLQLPMQSTIKDAIRSDPMENTKMAKISAALKACIKLYEAGELNDRLMPITKRECVQKVSDLLFQHWKQFDDDVTRKPGKQLQRLYERKCPDELFNSMPVIGEKCYAYEMKLQHRFEANNYTAHIAQLMSSTQNYALLLRKPLPRLAEMPFFMNQGELSVKIADTPYEFCITDALQLQQLRKFHVMLFRELLECWRNFFVMDARNKEHSYLIVPLRNQAIDWTLVREYQRLPAQRAYSVAERQRKVYRPEDFLGKVVCKWYGSDDSERLVVTKVRTDLTPQSSFNSSAYTTYTDYVESKYRDRIDRVVQPQQFLVEVQSLTSRRNFFVNAIGKNADIDRKRGTVILIPELCHNFTYPGDMWLKAIFLPSILHRLQVMLHADALRRRFNAYLGIESDPLSYRPKPLVIDKSLRRVVDTDGNAMEPHEEPKKMLSPLRPKELKTHFEIRPLLTQEASWKDYLEPDDITRKSNSIYPVELDYYYKFISGLATDLDAMQLAEEEQWTASQLQMPATKKSVGETSPLEWHKLSIADAPLEDKRRIDILARNAKLSVAEQFEFVAALTTSSANDVFDMERYELLGDSFLKFSASLYLANKFPSWHEGFLTVVKSQMISNRNLLYCMLATDIPQRICATLFKPKSEWLPPLVSLPSNVLELLRQQPASIAGISARDLYAMELSDEDILSGTCSAEHLECFVHSCSQNQELAASGVELPVENDFNCYIYKEALRDKVVADTLEALLGVCVKNYGIHKSFRMLEFFGICKPAGGDKPLTNLLDLQLGSHLLRAHISAKEVDGFLINYQNLERNLGYKFKDRAYLLQALTHPSFPTNRLTGCYQELEFIGDAILDFLISCYIFERNRHMTPGMLTDLRSALVNNITLGCVCVRHRFHLFLLAENSLLAESIKRFADFQETQGHRVTDQVRILMEEPLLINGDETDSYTKEVYNLSLNVDVPKALGDIVEALIAAVYLDSRDLQTTWNVIYHMLEQEITEFSHHVPIDPVRQLYEHPHADPKFSDAVIDNEVAMIKCHFTCLDRTVEVNGFGVNSTQAKKSAAKHALQILKKQAN